MISHPYRGLEVGVVTQHEKTSLIAPHFEALLRMKVFEININTDQFGTFAGDVPRVGTPREIVIKKAQHGLEANGGRFVIASEGSIGADPMVPFINSDRELMVFIDSELDIKIVESIRSPDIVAVSKKVLAGQNFDEVLKKADFPNHKLIVKSDNSSDLISFKGISTWEELEKAVDDCVHISGNKSVVIESDLRAHCSPSRQKVISTLAAQLAQRILQLCPSCSTPGWGVTAFTHGVICQQCNQTSEKAIYSEILGCIRCPYSTPGKVIRESLDPALCEWCNP